MRLRDPAACLLLLAAALAGCGDAGGEGAGSGLADVRFAGDPTARLDGNEVVWSLPLENRGNGTSGRLNLELSVRYSRAPDTPDEKTVDAGRLEAGQARTVEARTFYRGLGDYSGFVELKEGRFLLGRAPLWFEECPPVALC